MSNLNGIAVQKAVESRELHGIDSDRIILIDFTLHSAMKRLFVLKLAPATGWFDERSHHVAHGSGSASVADRGRAIKFSNEPDSHCSSLGAMKTGGVYYGKHGKSLKLYGLDKGVNDNVEKRCIVLHAADYVTDRFIKKNGRAGCSWGCLAIDPSISSKFIDKYENGTFVYVYGS